MADFERRHDSSQTSQVPKKPSFVAYKLLIDPVLTKTGLKVYRFDGSLPDDPLYPPVSVRDPRNPNMKARIWNRIEPLVLSIPHFKVDANYVGTPPPLEVTIKNVNDNINKNFLRDVLTKYGELEELCIYYHPINKKHLGLARVIFETTGGAKMCVDKLNNTSMMGQIIEVFFDPFGKKCKQIYENLTTERKVEVPRIEKRLSAPVEVDRNVKNTLNVDSTASKLGNMVKKHRTNNTHPRSEYTPSSDLGYGTTSERGSTYSEASHSSLANHYGSYQHDLYDTHSGKHPDTYLSKPYISSYQTGKDRNDFFRAQTENVVLEEIPFPRENNTSDEDSPKMDLDTRIKLMLQDKKDNQFGKIVGLTSSDSESDAKSTPHMRKRKNRLSLSKRQIWLSGSEEENVETAFAKKFKKNTFVPVDDENTKLNKKFLSPPPSPFLSLRNSSSQKQLNKAPVFDNELDLVSDESGGMSPRNKKQDEDDMSLSSLSPDDPSLIQLPPQPPPMLHNSAQPPLPAYPPHQSYFSSYSCMPNNQLQYDPYSYAPWNSQNNDSAVSFQPQPPPLEPFYFDDIPPPPPEPPNPEQDRNAFISTTIRIMLDRLVDELKLILKKDFQRKIMQNIAYKQFDVWVNDNEEKYKKQEQVKKERKLNTEINPKVYAPPVPRVNAGRLAFMTSVSKLPSFRKIVQVPVKREELSAKSGSDSESGSESDKEVKPPTRKRKNRRLTSLSSASVSSASSESSASDNESIAESVQSAPDLISDEEILFSEPEVSKKKPSVLLSGAENISDESSNEAVIPKIQNNIIEKDVIEEVVKVKEEVIEEPDFDMVIKEEPIELTEKDIIEQKILSRPSSPTAHLVDHNYCIQIPALPLPTTPLIDRLEKSPIHIKPPKRVQPTSGPKGRKRRKAFKRRNEEDERAILFQFLTLGVDEEDLQFLKKAYEGILAEDHSQGYWLNATHWVDYPATYNHRMKPDTSRRVHATGSARTEGFYKLTSEEKGKHKRQWGIQSTANNMKSLALAPVGVAHERPQGKQALSREARSNQRRLLTALGNEVDSDLLKFNQLKFRKKSLRFARSRIHDWGLFASETIAADEMVIEYVGQKIRPLVADVRERNYEAVGIGSSYLFRIDLENVIDATKGGNVSRFINHSCNPNCYAKIITIEGQKKIVIYSKQSIAVNEEITYDYKFPIEDNKIPCLCGSAQCRGTLN